MEVVTALLISIEVDAQNQVIQQTQREYGNGLFLSIHCWQTRITNSPPFLRDVDLCLTGDFSVSNQYNSCISFHAVIHLLKITYTYIGCNNWYILRLLSVESVCVCIWVITPYGFSPFTILAEKLLQNGKHFCAVALIRHAYCLCKNVSRLSVFKDIATQLSSTSCESNFQDHTDFNRHSSPNQSSAIIKRPGVFRHGQNCLVGYGKHGKWWTWKL